MSISFHLHQLHVICDNNVNLLKIIVTILLLTNVYYSKVNFEHGSLSLAEIKSRTKMKFKTFLIFCTYVLVMLIPWVTSVRIHYIHWNASSPIFRDPGSSHVIEIRGGRRDQPWDYEQV